MLKKLCREAFGVVDDEAMQKTMDLYPNHEIFYKSMRKDKWERPHPHAMLQSWFSEGQPLSFRDCDETSGEDSSPSPKNGSPSPKNGSPSPKLAPSPDRSVVARSQSVQISGTVHPSPMRTRASPELQHVHVDAEKEAAVPELGEGVAEDSPLSPIKRRRQAKARRKNSAPNTHLHIDKHILRAHKAASVKESLAGNAHVQEELHTIAHLNAIVPLVHSILAREHSSDAQSSGCVPSHLQRAALVTILGLIHRILDRPELSMKFFVEALALCPCPVARFHVACMHARSSRNERLLLAEELFQQHLSATGDWSVLPRLAELAVALGHFDRAYRLFRESMANDPSNMSLRSMWIDALHAHVALQMLRGQLPPVVTDAMSVGDAITTTSVEVEDISAPLQELIRDGFTKWFDPLTGEQLEQKAMEKSMRGEVEKEHAGEAPVRGGGRLFQKFRSRKPEKVREAKDRMEKRDEEEKEKEREKGHERGQEKEDGEHAGGDRSFPAQPSWDGLFVFANTEHVPAAEVAAGGRLRALAVACSMEDETYDRSLAESVVEEHVAYLSRPYNKGACVQPTSSVLTPIIHGGTCSLYPSIPGKRQGAGGPNTDFYATAAYEHAFVAALACGCEFGTVTQKAATRAAHGFMEGVQSQLDDIKDTGGIPQLLLQGVRNAHETIVNGSKTDFEVGTSALLGCVVLPIEDTAGGWMMACANVGTAKAFHYSIATGTLQEVTALPSLSPSDDLDYVGAFDRRQLSPQLARLALSHHMCYDGDLVFLVSDGVHDNFNPECLGLAPHDIGLDAGSWDALGPPLRRARQSEFTRAMIEHKIHAIQHPTPQKITTMLLSHARDMTRVSREWMEQHPGKRLPPNYAQFPGQLDHATCVCVRVGHFSERMVGRIAELWDHHVPVEALLSASFPPIHNNPLCARVCVRGQHVEVQCAVLARHMLEVTEDHSRVFLSQRPEVAADSSADGISGRPLCAPPPDCDELRRPTVRSIDLPFKIDPTTREVRVVPGSHLVTVTYERYRTPHEVYLQSQSEGE
eukprot:TRINITY_DN1445_c0_g1_i2.p1 TRINITY_DN1445_c0_g1~~TRINITY_DN1445_c0_g1_i2.p1  ORF type:complete len:1205 (-),score=385.88 TRINITY_DN1445_c0_g1_i2:176-3277(-)